MSTPAVLYFGCWDRPGHFLFQPNGQWPLSHATPFGSFGEQLDRDHYKPEEQTEGVARLTHDSGWTILAFWDRSVDRRSGCHSTFLAPGTWSAEEMIAGAREAFPSVWARYRFEVRMEVSHAG
jgi:hypothetical protein